MPSSNKRAARSGPRFDAAATVLAALFTGGLFLDGWAHTHGRVDDTFFTPWHAVLYSAFLAMAVLLVGRAAWGVAREGAGWRDAMPDGYGLSLAGAGCWVVGGPFDAVWHTAFGFEAGVDALLSPAHAILALGFGLMASGPVRAVLHRPPRGWLGELPMILSLSFVMAMLTFFTQIAHPLANLWAAGGRPEGEAMLELGVTGTLFTVALLTAPLLLLLRHGRFPAGATTILVGLNAVLMGFLYDRGPYPGVVVTAMVVAAVVVDLMRAWLRPQRARPDAFRAFAAAMPVVLTVAYFVALERTTGIAWSRHLWMGVIVFSGAVGWLLSYLVLPPRIVTDE